MANRAKPKPDRVQEANHRNLHAGTSTHAMKIYKENIGEKGGNHLSGPGDNFEGFARGSYREAK